MKYPFFKFLFLLLLFYITTIRCETVNAFELLESWNINSTILPQNLANLTTHLINDDVIVINGSGETGHTNPYLYVGSIDTNGSISGWNSSYTLNPPVIFHRSIKAENIIYIAGGYWDALDGSSYYSLDNLHVLKYNKSNDIELLKSIPLKYSRAGGGVVIISKRIYYLGGFERVLGGSITTKNNTFFTDINDDGSISGPWSDSLPLTSFPNQPSVGFATISLGNKIITIAGKDSNDIFSNKIYYGIVDTNTGQITSWEESPNALPTFEYSGYNMLNATIFGNYVIVAGGNARLKNSNEITNSDLVFYSEIQPDGTIGPWQTSTYRLPMMSCCGSLVANDQYLFYIGGFSYSYPGYYHDKIFYAKHNIPNVTPTITSSPSPSLTPTPTTTPSPSPSPIPTGINYPVPDQKQFDCRWKDEEYDSASKWSCTPSIENWGCALTSSSMILNYYGHNTNPKDLNIWLKQNNGYVANGNLWWPAISTYSNLAGHTGKILKFSSSTFSSSTLTSELSNGFPIIIKHPNPMHFIVAKGIKNTDFMINDPASNTHSLLSEVSADHQTPTELRIFHPTNTNLSALGIVLDQQCKLNLSSTDIGMTLSPSDYYNEPPIQSSINPNNSLNNIDLDVYLFQELQNGNYKLSIDNCTLPSIFDVYTHKTNGEFQINKLNLYNPNNITSVFNFSYNQENNNLVLSKHIDFPTLKLELDKAYSEKLIKSKMIYNSLKTTLNTSESYFKKNKYSVSKISLNFLISQIRLIPNRYINPYFSKSFIQDINYLLDSF